MPTPRCILRRTPPCSLKSKIIAGHARKLAAELSRYAVKDPRAGEGVTGYCRVSMRSRQALPSGATQLRVNLSHGLTIAPAVLTVLLQRALQDSGLHQFRKHHPSILNPRSYRRIPCARLRRPVCLRECFLLSDSKDWFGWNTAYTGELKSYFVTAERGFFTQAQH
ncbi:hypothetical protein E4T47_02581 [Aureobasidium subglaciale]|nr:hypothetical protein E4T47_02581 [Aureobasidium subglaciale]